MATLADMKARILRETTRDDLVDVFEDEIRSAIQFYRAKRFWFTEQDRRITFTTIAGQTDYGKTSHAYIPDLVRIDFIQVDHQGRKYPLKLATPGQINQWLSSSSMESNPPAFYSYYDRKLRFYPEPDDSYPIEISGVVYFHAPATDDEQDNPWMNEAEELIRFRAKRNIYLNHFFGTEQGMAQAMAVAESEAYKRLRVETSSRSQVRSVRSSCA